ncbi:MAG TPA: cyclic nucleotide-binding domain-containing protein [Candidatus Sulfotelmatobacter sp.]|nr:cyclic nucleotide-binding domain-containing protein [Candidatus Sulfotelmatobacter sp.]
MVQAVLVSMSVVYGSNLASSLFLANAGAGAIPLYYVLFAALSIPLSILFSGVIDCWPRRTIMAVLLTVYMIAGTVASLFVGTGVVGCFALYIIVSICELMLYGVYYIFFADYFTLTENKRHSGFLTVALAAGALLGAFLVSVATHFVPPRSAYLALPALVALTLWHLRWLTNREAPLDGGETAAEEGILESLKSLPSLSRRHPIVLAMAVAMFVNVFVQCIMEFEAFSLYTASYPDEESLSRFMAMMGGVVEVVGVMLVFCVSEPLITRFGVAKVNLLPPVINIVSFVAIACSSSIFSGILAHVNYSPLEYSLNAPLFALIYNAVPYRFTGRVRVINDGVVYPLALAASGGLLLWLQHSLSLPQVALIGLFSACLYALAQWSVGRQYLQSLMELLRSGAVELDRVGKGLRLSEEYLSDILSMANSGNSDEAAMGLDLAVRGGLSLPPPAWERALAVVPVGPARAALEMLAADRSGKTEILLNALAVSDHARIRTRVLEAQARHPSASLRGNAKTMLSDGDECVRAVAAAVLSPWDIPQGLSEDAALAVLYVLQGREEKALPDGFLSHASPKVRAESLGLLSRQAVRGEVDILRQGRALLADADSAVRAAAAGLVLGLADDAVLPDFADMAFADAAGEVRRGAALALGRRGGAGLDILAERLGRSGADDLAILMEGVGEAGIKVADQMLFAYLSETVFPVVARNRACARFIPEDRPHWDVLRLAIVDADASAVQTVLQALSVLGYRRVLTLVRITLKSDDARAKAHALETLSSLDHRHYVAPLLPLLDGSGQDAKAAPFDPGAARAALAEQMIHGVPFVQVAAMMVWRAEFGDLPLPHHADPSPLMAETLRAVPVSPGCYDEEAPMNRLVFLKSVPLFSELSLDQLMAVDGALVRESFLPGESIVTEGDLGDQLYLLFRGVVAVRKRMPDGSERELAQLSPGQLFGEMALFDDERRSATVVALEDTELLALNQQRFHSLASQRPEIPMQICKVLVSRLRQAIA